MFTNNNKIFLIFLFHSVSAIYQSCRNPYIQELETKFQQYQIDYLRFGQAMLKAAKLSSSDFFKNFSQPIDQSCSVGEKFEKIRNGLCLSLVNIEYVRDRYPNYKSTVKCKCELCTTFKNGIIDPNYECQPVYKRVPVLKKGNCSRDGYYQWEPTTELLTIGCACGINRILVPF